MTDLAQFIPELKQEKYFVIKNNCTFEEARAEAIKRRAAQQNKSVGWCKEENNTYAVFGVNI